MLVRHGETPWNLEHRLQGQQYPGPPLNATGEHQAAAVGTALQFPTYILHHTIPCHTQVAAHLAQQQVDVVYASDLLRAQQTMQAIMQALPNTVQVCCTTAVVYMLWLQLVRSHRQGHHCSA